MNVLFDIISAQASYYNGASEYTRKLFNTFRDRISKTPNMNLFTIYDSRFPILFNEMTISELEKDKRIGVIDIAKFKSVQEVVNKYKIDILYICLAQRWNNYDLSGINCKVFCTIHDLWNFECEQNNIVEYVNISNSWFLFKQKMKRWFHSAGIIDDRFRNLLNFLKNTNQLTVVSVSEYTKASIMNIVGIKESDILVSWSPLKESKMNDEIENPVLKELIRAKKRFYLIVSANRLMKNANKTLKAFHRYAQITNDDSVIVTVGLQKRIIEEQVPLPFISGSDLENAYANCYALIYGSLFEGFGYPPVEAMKFSKPVLASNVCSIREVLGDAPIYFSPFYDTDIFHSLFQLNETNYEKYCKKSKDRSLYIESKQKADLLSLVERVLKSKGNCENVPA